MGKGEDYKHYLDGLHSAKETPDDLIRDVVKGEIGIGITSKKRIVAGEINEVYEISLVDNSHLILRVSSNGYPDFQQELWSIEKCKKVDVPVPDILAIKYVVFDNKQYSFCLMNKIDGDLLDRGIIDFSKLKLTEQRSFILQAGEILSRIHSIQTEGFGKITDKGRSEFTDSNQIIDNWIKRQGVYEQTAKETGLDKSVIKAVLKSAEFLKPVLATIQPHLNHGDYFFKHIIVRENKIVCILDWGEVRSDSPIYDIANWDFWEGKHFPIKWLKDGYKDKKVFSNGFEDIFHFMKIMVSLEVLEWYHARNVKGRVEKAKSQLIENLGYFD